MQQFNHGHINGTLAATPSVIQGTHGAHFIKFAITTPEVAGSGKVRAANQTIDVTLYRRKGEDFSAYLQMHAGDEVACDFWVESREGKVQNFMVLCTSEVEKTAPLPVVKPLAESRDYFDDILYDYSPRRSEYDDCDISYEFTPDDELFEAARCDPSAREELARRGCRW